MPVENRYTRGEIKRQTDDAHIVSRPPLSHHLSLECIFLGTDLHCHQKAEEQEDQPGSHHGLTVRV